MFYAKKDEIVQLRADLDVSEAIHTSTQTRDVQQLHNKIEKV